MSFYKTRSTFVSVLSLLAILFVSPSFALADFVKDGAVSGGGGGILPPGETAITVDDILDLIQDSKPEVWNFFKYREQNLISGYSDESGAGQLVISKTDAFEIINKIEIVASKTGCTDFDGSNVDGSINTKYRYGVCLSLDSLQKRLFKSNYKSQILALVIHEISHLLGADEATAVAIQKEAFRVQKANDITGPSNFVSRAAEFRRDSLGNADIFRTFLTGFSDFLRKNETLTCDAMKIFRFNGIVILGSNGDGLRIDSTYMSQQLYKKWQAENTSVIYAIVNYTCSLLGSGESDDKRSDYLRAYNAGSTKFKSPTDLATYVDKLNADVQEYIDSAANFDFNFKIHIN